MIDIDEDGSILKSKSSAPTSTIAINSVHGNKTSHNTHLDIVGSIWTNTCRGISGLVPEGMNMGKNGLTISRSDSGGCFATSRGMSSHDHDHGHDNHRWLRVIHTRLRAGHQHQATTAEVQHLPQYQQGAIQTPVRHRRHTRRCGTCQCIRCLQRQGTKLRKGFEAC